MAGAHVIEIFAGTGEPRRMELRAGVELAPLSIGTQGSWRLRADGVLGVHAHVYFDGEALFVRSADETKPALVDGRAVGSTWVPLTAPSTIELGSARLSFRALEARVGDDDRTIPLPSESAGTSPPKPPAYVVPPPRPIAGARWAQSVQRSPEVAKKEAPVDPDQTRPQEGRTRLLPQDQRAPAPPRAVTAAARPPAPRPPSPALEPPTPPLRQTPPTPAAPPPTAAAPAPREGFTNRMAKDWNEAPALRKAFIVLAPVSLLIATIWFLLRAGR